MAHFQVTFKDIYHGVFITHFDDFTEAQEYWNDYADAPTCESGVMTDLDNGEIIWEFGEKF